MRDSVVGLILAVVGFATGALLFGVVFPYFGWV